MIVLENVCHFKHFAFLLFPANKGLLLQALELDPEVCASEKKISHRNEII
jgi:hypothetical protein